MAKNPGNPHIAEYGKNTRFSSNGHGLDAVEMAKRSNESQRRTKSMSELAKMIAKNPVSKKSDKKILESIGVIGEDQTQSALVIAALLSKALDGDVKAIEKWQELTSEESDNKIEALKQLLGSIGKID